MNTEVAKYRNYILRNYNNLPQLNALSDDEREAIGVVGQVLPFKTNNYVVEQLIDWNNVPNDPIYTLTFPRREMLSEDRKSTRLNSSHVRISYAVFCLK